MLFNIISTQRSIPSSAANMVFLIKDRWDDWGKYQTQFYVIVFDSTGNKFEPGSVKIGHKGLQSSRTIEPGKRAPELDSEFDALPEEYFSLGQGENYYETINTIPEKLRIAILQGLRDCAWDLDLFEAVKDEEVMTESLLRDVRAENVRNRLHRLSKGDAVLTEFQFEYAFPGDDNGKQPVMQFQVEPDSEPPTNVHVIIGRNGVGKTRCLQFMRKALLGRSDEINPTGEFRLLGRDRNNWAFAGLISVSFSAFDDFDVSEEEQEEKTEVRSFIVGLRQRDKDGVSIIKTPKLLATDFSNGLQNCRTGLKAERWRAAVHTLENDPLFEEADITSLLEEPKERFKAKAARLFSRLSSGHAIVLLTITRLVELVDERTLLLLDEPESHLHPPLLSAFIRSLADLLIKRNGAAIIASHSPVVLQEVPASCVWMLRRSGTISVAERPSIETFGENVGILTREVFGLEVTNTGFHKLLHDAVYNERLSYKRLLSHFSGQLGAEARAIARGMIAERDDVDGYGQ